MEAEAEAEVQSPQLGVLMFAGLLRPLQGTCARPLFALLARAHGRACGYGWSRPPARKSPA
mgnify:CR=1 FL=1